MERLFEPLLPISRGERIIAALRRCPYRRLLKVERSGAAFSYRLRVAVITARRNLRATRHWIPDGISPFNARVS